MRKRDDFEDDGRTIADMSGIGPAPTLRPHRRKADAPPPEPANDLSLIHISEPTRPS